jgi:hypothetical protein
VSAADEAGAALHRHQAPIMQSAARAAVAMDLPTWLHRVPVTEPDGAGAAAREAAPGDSGLEGSHRCLGVTVTWAELRVALRLSVVCVVSVALLAVPAGAVYFLVNDQVWATFGKGVHRPETFHDADRMQRHEPFIVDFDWSTPTTRSQHVFASSFYQTILLFFIPNCYVAYLGASVKVCCLALGSAVLAFTVASVGFVISGQHAFITYSLAFGFALLIVALKRLCPRNSKIPTQATKQALVLMVGNVLVWNVIPETTVRTALLT